MALQRKPLPVDGDWLLTDHDSKTAQEWMLAAIVAPVLTAAGWTGTPLPSPEGGIDRVQFSHASGATKTAAFGQWVVLDAGELKVLTVEECDVDYDEAP